MDSSIRDRDVTGHRGSALGRRPARARAPSRPGAGHGVAAIRKRDHLVLPSPEPQQAESSFQFTRASD